MKVRFVPDEHERRKYLDLTPRNLYHVIGIEADDYRIMSDEGRPYLYPRRMFRVVNTDIPPNWKTYYDEDAKRYSYPPELCQPGFFEDFFDGVRKAEIALRLVMARLVGRSSES